MLIHVMLCLGSHHEENTVVFNLENGKNVDECKTTHGFERWEIKLSLTGIYMTYFRDDRN